MAVVAVGGLLAAVHVFVGFDQLARWAGSVASNARQPGTSIPESHNWAGYAATGGTFTSVSATWNVPEFAPDSPAGADAIWVGIGGVRGNDLIQAGTQETVSGHDSTEYQAWIETLPQASRPVPLAVNAGDSISVSLQEQAGDDWLTLLSITPAARPTSSICTTRRRGPPLSGWSRRRPYGGADC